MKTFLVTFILLLNAACNYGQNVPVIKMQDLDNILQLKEPEIVVINFWATWCSPCVKELPLFEALNSRKDPRIKVFMISVDFADQLDKVKSFVARKNLTAEVVLLDEMDYNSWIGKVDDSWQGAIPATLIKNTKTGQRKFIANELQDGELEKIIQELSKNVKIMKLANAIIIGVFLLIAGRAPQYTVGDTVKDFSLKNTDGKMVSLSDYKDSKGIIVVFHCNTCPMSKAYDERIIELGKKYKSQGFPLIAINANDPGISPGDSYDEMVAQAKEKSYDFPYLVDETQNVAKAFGATNTPHVYILKRDGNTFKVAYVGAIDNNARDEKAASKRYVEDAIESLIADKPVPVEKTKAIGCSIKYRNT